LLELGGPTLNRHGVGLVVEARLYGNATAISKPAIATVRNALVILLAPMEHATFHTPFSSAFFYYSLAACRSPTPA
jgi:hypothetical protein